MNCAEKKLQIVMKKGLTKSKNRIIIGKKECDCRANDTIGFNVMND